MKKHNFTRFRKMIDYILWIYFAFCDGASHDMGPDASKLLMLYVVAGISAPMGAGIILVNGFEKGFWVTSAVCFVVYMIVGIASLSDHEQTWGNSFLPNRGNTS